MNKYAINSVVFALGICVGALAARFWLKNQYANLAQDEIDSVKAAFAKREEQLLEHINEVQPKKPAKNTHYKMRLEDLADYRARMESYGADHIPEQTEEDRLSTVMNMAEQMRDSGEGSLALDLEETFSREHAQPYLIADSDFLEGMAGFDKITITYYEADDILADDQDEVITDVSAHIGDDALVSFNKKPGAEGVVYVRNIRLSTDFEVVLDRRSFSEVVVGIVPDKPLLRKMRDARD